MDIQQNNVAVLHFNLVNQDGSTIFIRKTKLATFNLINPSEVSVPITDIGFDATLNQCWVRIPKASNAATGQYYGVLNIVDDDWGTYTTSKIKVYSVVSDADEDTKSVVFTATCIATQVTNPSGGNSPYYNTTTETWWQYSDTLKAFEDTGVGNLIKYITKNVQHLKDGTGNGSIVTCFDDEISANNIATGLCSTDLGKNNDNRGESCVALGENNYIAEGVSNAIAIAGARPSIVDVFAVGDKTAGNKNVFVINKFGDISLRPDSSQERTAILQDILDHVIKNAVYDSSKYSLTVTFYSAADNANKTKTYDLSGLKAVLKDDAVKKISVNQSTAVMTVDTINGSSQQIQLPTTYLPLAGGTLTGDLIFSDSGTATRGIYGTVGSSDAWRLIGDASADDSGWLELATANDGTEPIYVRQYTFDGGIAPYGHFGTPIRTATLLDELGNTSFPGTVTASAFSGNASSATKLATARSITLSGDTTGTATFDGSANITITTSTNGYLTYNVTSKIPLSEGNYYIPSTARLAIPLSSRYSGQNITYCTALKEVVRLTLTSGCTTSGNIQIILNNAIFTIALDNSTDTTPALVAAKIASNTFPVWTVVYNAGDTYVQFQKNNIGANLSPGFFTGTTGAYGSITATTKGANEDWISETYIGSLLDDASWGNNNNWKKDVSESELSQSKYIEGVKSANLFNKKGPFFIGAIQNTGLSSNATNFITTDKIYVTAGKTYRRYVKPSTPYSFSTNCRYFDDNGYLGTMSTSDTEVTIPSNASNPYIYITLYPDPSVINLSDYEQVMFLESTVDSSKYIPYYTIETSIPNIPIDYYKSCKNYGKSVGVFGGSLSVYAESDNAKNMWRNLLGMTVTNYGVPGAGFSSLQGTSVQQQVDGAGVHDIYILWCSTNDFGGNQQIGTYNDYSTADSYDNKNLVTQCGGINYAIKKLLEKNPLAEIYLFTSLKFFSSESGYNPFSTVTNTAGNTFKQYVDAQVECAKRFGIPVLDQFNLQGINEYNYTNYYNVDNLHMNANGYKKIGMVQVDFLSNGK